MPSLHHLIAFFEWQPGHLSGADKMEYYKKKFGPQAEAMLKDPNNMLNVRGRPMGIEFNYHEGSRVFNTFSAHRVMELALRNSVQTQNDLCEVLFRKYFKEGKDLSQISDLVDAAEEAASSPACRAMPLKCCGLSTGTSTGDQPTTHIQTPGTQTQPHPDTPQPPRPYPPTPRTIPEYCPGSYLTPDDQGPQAPRYLAPGPGPKARMDRTVVEKLLSSNKGAQVQPVPSPDPVEEVASAVRTSSMQCNGVPHFVFPDGQQVSGGQDEQVFKSILEGLRAKVLRCLSNADDAAQLNLEEVLQLRVPQSRRD
eukprot:gene2312-3155_t